MGTRIRVLGLIATLVGAVALATSPIGPVAAQPKKEQTSKAKAKPKPKAKAKAKPRAQPKPAAPALPAPAAVQTDGERLRLGLMAAAQNRFDLVRGYRGGASDLVVQRILQWRTVSDPDAPVGFEELAAGLRELPGWPGRDGMRRRAETLIFDSTLSPQQRIDWLLAEAGPLSGDGQVALAQAYARLGRRQDAQSIAREAFRERALGPRAESVLISEFSDALSGSDYAARVDFLIWRDARGDAQRYISRLDSADRAVAEARMNLQARNAAGFQAALARVPAERVNDPGILFERARFLRRADRQDEALPYIRELNPLDAIPYARDEIFTERRLYVSRALRAGDPRLAYRLAANHGLTSGESFADAEWLAGWLALRWNSDPGSAARHFARLDSGVRAPVSRARALYWRAEAEQALGNSAAAQTYLAQAAELDFTYYGQLAAVKRDPRHALSLGDPATPSQGERMGFEARDTVRALKLLGNIGAQAEFEQISFALDDQLTTAAEHEMLSALARQYNYWRTAVRSAKAGVRRGIVAKEGAFPIMTIPEEARAPGRPEPALVLAITRQESEFDPRAMSPVGARGLMQLMPATARATARSIGAPYDLGRLTSDPAYNITLGAAHLEDLLDEFSGSYVMAIAAYNAGGSRPRQWMVDWGDPRTGRIDVIDWIELIPFSETRNYVQRVMENLQVYRYRLAGTPTPVRIAEDLRR